MKLFYEPPPTKAYGSYSLGVLRCQTPSDSYNILIAFDPELADLKCASDIEGSILLYGRFKDDIEWRQVDVYVSKVFKTLELRCGMTISSHHSNHIRRTGVKTQNLNE